MSQFIPIPKNYERNKSPYLPKLLKGHAHSFYCNTDQLMTNQEFAGFELDLFDADGVVDTAIAELVKHQLNGSGYRWYTETLVLDNDLIKNKEYFLALIDKSGFEIRNLVSGSTFNTLTEDLLPKAIRFKPDGKKMFVLGSTNDTVYQYTLSTAWDETTAVYDIVSFSVTSEDILPTGMDFSSDGLKMFIVGDTNDAVKEYTLSTAWNLSGVVYSGNSFSLDGITPKEIHFNYSGTKFYTIEGTVDLKEYVLITAWDITTARFTGREYAVGIGTPSGLWVAPNGDKVFVYVTASERVFELKLPNRGEIDSADYEGVSTVLGTDSPLALCFSPDGLNAYNVGPVNGVTGRSITAGKIRGWDVSTAVFSTDSGALIQADTQALEFNDTGTKFYGADAAVIHQHSLSTAFLSSTDSYDSITLTTPEVTITTIRFSGDGRKLFVAGTTSNTIYQYDLAVPYALGSALISINKFVFGTGFRAFSFDKTGMILYVGWDFSASFGDKVTQYSLHAPFNITNPKETNTVQFTLQPNMLFGEIRFNDRGDIMYFMNTNDDEVNYYTLSTAWSIASATYSGFFQVIAKEPGPLCLAFNNDGTKMFVSGVNEILYEYDLDQTNETPVLMTSNCFNAIDDDDVDEFAYLQITNPEDVYGIGYGDTGIVQDIFLDINELEANPLIEIDTYKEITTGEIRNLGSSADLEMILETHRFDKEAHEMMGIVAHHGDVKINGKSIVPSGYERDHNKTAKRSNGRLTAKDSQYSKQGKFN